MQTTQSAVKRIKLFAIVRLRKNPKPVLMTPERRSFTLDSTLETVDNAEQAASEIASESGLAEEEVLQIAMAVPEAAVNAVLHGNAYEQANQESLEYERKV